MTPADVVYSLDRAMSPSLGGFYTLVFSRVKSIAATGGDQVTITLKQPDYWLPGELASMPGIVIEKAFAQKQGKKYGTPSGSIMCTGAYKLKSFVPGVGVTAVPNPHYWQPSVKPLAQPDHHQGRRLRHRADLRPDHRRDPGHLHLGRPVHAAAAEGRQRGERLPRARAGRPTRSSSSNLKGVLGDVRVREALSLALNRQAVISATSTRVPRCIPHWLANPGVFGYGKSVFAKAYDASPALSQNLAKAKKLVKEAGATGKTFTIGTSQQIANIATEHRRLPAAANAIGLKTVLQNVSAQNYINFFIDPKARAGVDGFLTENYGDYADPAALLSTLAIPGGSQNYDNFNDQKIITWLEQARSTAEPGRQGGPGRQGRAARGQAAALDPGRAADQPADHVQEPDRRDRVLRLHVRALGEQPGRAVSPCAGGSWPAGWRCSSPACWSPAS